MKHNWGYSGMSTSVFIGYLTVWLLLPIRTKGRRVKSTYIP